MITNTQRRQVLLAGAGAMPVQLGESWPDRGPLVSAVKDKDLMRSWLQGLGLGQRFAVARPDHYGSVPSATDVVALLEQFHEQLYHPPPDPRGIA